MLPQEMNTVCKDAFIELVNQASKFHGRTYCYFHPFRGKNPSYHITVVDKETGYGVVIPLTPKSAMLLDKENMKEVYVKILDGLLLATHKHKQGAKPVDYRKFPIKAEGRECRFETVVNNSDVTVEVYGWSKLIV